MSAVETRPSASLRGGRRSLEGVEGVKITEDLRFHALVGRFSLRLRLSLAEVQSQSPVPLTSDWVVLIDPCYPLGPIKVHPAREGGLRGTFPHQAINREQAREIPWLSGNLCLETPERAPLGRLALTQEPSHPDLRLRWHVLRAMDWLEAAASGRLLQPGDPFELPAVLVAPDQPLTLVFSEDQRSLLTWLATKERVGRATLIDAAGKHAVVAEFSHIDGRSIMAARWGYALSESALPRIPALWMRLDAPPTLHPWQAPCTFGGLRRAARTQGIELDAMLRPLVNHLRDHERSILLLGSPIPERVGEQPAQMHWQVFELPRPGAKKAETPPSRRSPRQQRSYLRGFRDNALGRWQKERQGKLADERPLRWLNSENWHSDRTGARGRFMEQLRLSKIAIVGVGALGALLGELLIRGGAEDVLLIDHDKLAVGNLVRHPLHMDALGENKARALAEHLNTCSPHARVAAVDSILPWDPQKAQEQIADRQILLDCTGEDGPLEVLAQIASPEPKLFFSISVGRAARRLYFFSASARSFPRDEFHAQLTPWLTTDWQGVSTRDLPWEGAGCWHPLWPGRLDDLMLLAATSAKLLEAGAAKPEASPRLQVFERWNDADETFAGLRRVLTPESGEHHG